MLRQTSFCIVVVALPLVLREVVVVGVSDVLLKKVKTQFMTLHDGNPFTTNNFWDGPKLGNGRNTVSRVLFRRRELTEFCGTLELGEFALAHK